MKKLIYYSILLLTGLALNTYGQHIDGTKKAGQYNPEQSGKKMGPYYMRALSVDSAKADQIVRIISDYKAGMNALTTNQLLTEEAKRGKIKALMEEKNQKLSAILSPAQQVRIIPGTERDPSQDTKRKPFQKIHD